jgi:hypothetical protein
MRRSLHRALCTAAALAGLGALAACRDDPRYIAGGSVDADPEAMEGVAFSVPLPIEIEDEADRTDREALAAELGMPADQVPYVRVDDLDVAVEYSVTNRGDQPGQAFVEINGANQYFVYVPSAFSLDEDDEDAVPPPLMGGFPITVAPGGRFSDVIREDQVREASIDLELITRGGLFPTAALLTVHEDLEVFQPVAPIDPEDPGAGVMPVGDPISVRAFGQLIRLDVVFRGDTGMHLDLAVRIRDHRRIVHPELLAAPAGELTMFAPADYAPATGEPAP